MITNLLRDGAAYTLGTLVTRGLGLVLLPLYAHSLSPSDFGVLDLILTAGVLINLVVPLETPQAIARFWNERHPGADRKALAGTGIIFAGTAYCAFVLATWRYAPDLLALIGSNQRDPSIIYAGLLAISCSGFLLVVQANFRWMLRPWAFVASAVMLSILNLLGLVVLVVNHQADVVSVLGVQAAAAFIVAVVSLWLQRNAISWGIDCSELRRLLAFSGPLVPAGVATFAALHIHRYILSNAGTLEYVGLFGMASRVAGVATLILLGVQAAVTPLIYAHHKEPTTPVTLARLFEFFTAIGIMVCLALAALGDLIFYLLAPATYQGSAVLVAWLSPAALLAQLYVFSPGIPLAKKTHLQLALTIFSACVGVFAALILVPIYLALGAAWAALLSSATFLCGWMLVGQRLYPLPIRWFNLTLAVMIFLVASILMARLPDSGLDFMVIIIKLSLILIVTGFLFGLRLLRWPVVNG